MGGPFSRLDLGFPEDLPWLVIGEFWQSGEGESIHSTKWLKLLHGKPGLLSFPPSNGFSLYNIRRRPYGGDLLVGWI
jgi:hypothetical protein